MNRKKLIIVQIVLWLIIILVFVGVLAIGITNQSKQRSDKKWWSFDKGLSYEKEYVVDLEKIEDFNIIGVSETIIVESSNESQLKIIQKSSSKIKEIDELKMSKGKNSIKVYKKRRKIIGRLYPIQKEQIEIYVPKDYEGKLNVVTVSGDVHIEDVVLAQLMVKSTSGDVVMQATKADKVKLVTISGDIEGQEVGFRKLDAITTSGKMRLTGEITKANFKSTSGDISLVLGDDGEEVSMVTVSGDINLKLLEEQGFTVVFSSVSGNLAIQDKTTKGKKITHIQGDGDLILSLSTVSGDGKITFK